MRALIVDDEEPALAEMRFLLESSGEFDRVDVTQSALNALKFIKNEAYDVVFLDIQMPGITGLELADLLRGFASPPMVVFVTAYDEHAIQAFELRAADYLLKPVSQSRLRDTIETLRSRLVGPQSQAPARQPRDLLERLPVEVEGRTILVDLKEIRFAVAHGDVVQVKTAGKCFATRFSLAELEKRLPSPPFLKTHRAYIVNLRNVVEIYPYFNGAYVLRVNDAERSEVPVSRGQAKTLRALLGI